MGSGGGVLAGKHIAVTGRLASMTRDEVVDRIEAAGAVYDPTPSDDTSLLVVGEAGWPLSADGRLTHSLETANELREQYGSIDIVSETEFLSALGLEGHGPEVQRCYTAQQLSRILKTPYRELLSWVRSGLVVPVKRAHRLSYFDFAEVARAKALRELVKSGVSTKQLRKSMQELETWMPEAKESLAQLDILDQGGKLLVRLGDGGLADTHGQLHFDFLADDEDAEAEADGGGNTISFAAHLPGAEDWFEKANRLEEVGDLDGAADAYHQALLVGGLSAEITFNLGNVLFSLGQKEAAAQRFMQTVELEPDYVESWNNLGNALFDLGRSEEADRAFRRALEIDPDYADAHYNLAEVLFHSGEIGEARFHWQSYLRQDPFSTWAQHVRKRLEITDRMD